MRSHKNIPFEFVFDYLTSLDVTVKPMFGMFALYVDRKIVLGLRDRMEHPEANGVWIATEQRHHASLKKDLPSMRSIFMLSNGTAETNWQMLPIEADDFEKSVIKVCGFIVRGDPRIGRTPKQRKKKKKGL